MVPRFGLRFFRGMGRLALSFLAGVGGRVLFFREIRRAIAEWPTWRGQVFPQMRAIGVDSLPLAIMVAAFIGGVIAIQMRYQLFPGIQLSIVGLSTRQIVILETGPLLTGLVLAGRVGAKMTAEIATMRVTEQIDALETLAYDPVAYLVVPRLIAATIMLPILTILADFVGVGSGFFISVAATDMTTQDFLDGVRLAYSHFQIVYSLMKATLFGIAIAFVCTYEGYITTAGAEGVGRSTARAVVITSVTILVLDALTAALFAPLLQA